MTRQTICFKDTNHVQRLVVLLPESSKPEEMIVESRPTPLDPILPLLPATPMSNATPFNRHEASTVPFYIPKCIKKLHLPCQHINLFLININSKTDRQSNKSNKTILPALFQIWTNLCGLGLAFEWACTTHSQELISSHMWRGLSQMSLWGEFCPSTPGPTRWLCRSTNTTSEGKNANTILDARLRL
jgi:hypothetical protein